MHPCLLIKDFFNFFWQTHNYDLSFEIQAIPTQKASATHKKLNPPTPISPENNNATQCDHSAFDPEVLRVPNNPEPDQGGNADREWDSTVGEELPDTECLEFQPALGDEEDIKIATESGLDCFTKFLVDAQIAAQKAEHRREQESGQKQIRGTYTGHSKQTKWHNKKAKESLKAKGFLGLADF
ncbi:hypothetical protein B0H10DRAFT_1968939 [Mycena sp. CBHHK59/15]|nr:hypothetical protein B0H10DRAFT_1968939 [Mycena sp. CBHHK59/15]